MAERNCPKSINDLDRLENEELIAYIAEQRDAGRPECAREAMAILAFGYWNLVLHHLRGIPDYDKEDVASEVIQSALKSAFNGQTIGEFVNWLKVIIRRRAWDYRRTAKRIEKEPLAEENADDDQVWGKIVAVDDHADEVAIRETALRVLDDRSDQHRCVIEHYGPDALGWASLSAAETVAATNALFPGETMTEANVHQIWRRFKREVGEQLGLGGS